MVHDGGVESTGGIESRLAKADRFFGENKRGRASKLEGMRHRGMRKPKGSQKEVGPGGSGSRLLANFTLSSSVQHSANPPLRVAVFDPAVLAALNPAGDLLKRVRSGEIGAT